MLASIIIAIFHHEGLLNCYGKISPNEMYRKVPAAMLIKMPLIRSPSSDNFSPTNNPPTLIKD